MATYRGMNNRGVWSFLPNFLKVNGFSYLCGDDGFIVKKSDDGVMAVRGEFIEVTADSVGRDTDKKDKNNKKIFEGDILRVTTMAGQTTTNTDYLVKDSDSGYIAEAITAGASDSALSAAFLAAAAIIGNKMENPELLGDD